jgi:hypothetical protein
MVEIGGGQRTIGPVAAQIDDLEAGAAGLGVVGHENHVELRPLLDDVEKELAAVALEELRGYRGGT